jgi:hypothetical protein
MNPLLDCEFADFIDCRLISIGIVSEDGREFYGEYARVGKREKTGA